ncbi:MAG: hypothetical protein WDO73_06800 [Ignavibacteriota bacterium]
MKSQLLFSVMAFCALLAPARPAETREERGKRIVYDALQALGGDAFLHMNDRLESGARVLLLSRANLGTRSRRIYTRYLAPVPGKVEVRERENFGVKEDSGVLLLEDAAWDISYRGARPLPDDKFANYQTNVLRNILYILRQRLKEPGLAFYSQGSDMFENRPVEIVDITDADTNTVTVYFDQRSKFPVRQTFRRRNEQFHDFDTEVTIFGLYRNVGDGVMWPCNIRRERNGERIYEMFADQVEINKDLRDNLFALPGDVKVLPKGK